MSEFKLDYLAAGGNKNPAAADWDRTSDLLAYGAENNVALWKPLNEKHCGVHALLRGHTDKVNAVKFFPVSDGQRSIILSGSADHTVRVWIALATTCSGFEELEILRGHSSSINCLAAASSTCLFASGSADATVKIWKSDFSNGSNHCELVQTIQDSPKFFPLALNLTELGTTGDLMLAVAGTRGFVQIYVAEDGEFSLQSTLAGHEGWVRSLAVVQKRSKPNDDILLASASQDRCIRLWRIRQGRTIPNLASSKQNTLGSVGKTLSNKTYWLKASGLTYALTFEALLLGHEDWIYTVSWQMDGKCMRLLSASADNSLAFWEPEASSGVWVCTTRLGEISAQKGSTTANGSTGGFWIALWSSSGDNVVSLGRTGSWRLWTYNKKLGRWMQGIGISGHTKPVTDIAWENDGTYLLSTGSDQTTRLHAEWRRKSLSSWHELARPQIHGYSLHCLDSVGPSQFISGADEKLLRVFDEPRATADLLYSLCRVRVAVEQDMPDAADIQVLGLSNKVIKQAEFGFLNDGDGQNSSEQVTTTSHRPYDINRPPLEDHLARQTLWPEREKLYGHGYEISAVASSHNGTIVATACKASSMDHAAIRLYTTKDWREVKPSLMIHSLTVTCLRFSKDDRYLLSVGRDRQWVVFEREGFHTEVYKLKQKDPKAHHRMILSASWAPPEAGLVFATAGRDKAVKLWSIMPGETECVKTFTASSPVTAIDIFPKYVKGAIIIAVGTEDADVFLHFLGLPTLDIRRSYCLDDQLRPSKSITRLAWRPPLVESNMDQVMGERKMSPNLQLAIASEDGSLRLFSINKSAWPENSMTK
ncbi:hypothetical protein MMC07_007089 [Pseudocyphellaria aurata]|nr:hypothetical protein [Pseudocyphellaria aurata]